MELKKSPAFTPHLEDELRESLKRCSPETVEAALGFRQYGNFDGIPVIVLGIIVMKMDSLTFDLKNWSSFLWAVTSAFSFASMQVLAKRIIDEINPQVLNVSRLAITLIILWSLAEVRSGVTNLQSGEWKWIALAAFCGPFMGRVSYTYALRC